MKKEEQTMENKELNTNDLEQVSGGSIFNRESSIRDAGIELRNEDGTPGSFGIFYNSGDYYFQNQKIDQKDVDALEKYYEKFGTVAPSLAEARKKYPKFNHRRYER